MLIIFTGLPAISLTVLLRIDCLAIHTIIAIVLLYYNIAADILECDSDPCQNDAVCYDQVNGYTCGCLVATTGVQCETS